MLKTFGTGRDNSYNFKARLIKECLSHIKGSKGELTDNKLASEIKTAFSYHETNAIQLDHIDLCNIIRTLVILKITPQGKIEIFKLWQNIAINQIDMFDSQAIANPSTAITKLKVNEKIELPHRETKEILKALIQKAKEEIKDFNSQEIANTLWALAKLEVKREEVDRLVPELVEAALNNIKHFNSQDIANTLWTLAKLESKQEEIDRLLPELVKAALNNIKHFNSQEIANTLWTLAKLESKQEEIDRLLPSLINAALKNIKHFNSQNIANTLWALAVLEQDLNNFSSLKEKIIKRLEVFKLEDFTIEEKNQLFQALTYYNLFPLLSNLGINTELIKKELASPLSSKLHKDVENNLQLLLKASLNDNEVISEFFLPEIASHIDIKLQYRGKTYYIEVDGPTHFNEEGNYTAIDKFHNRLFEKACPGEIMIRLPYFFLEGKTQQGQPSGSQPNLSILLQKILEDIEKLEKSGVYIATLKSKEEEIPALLKRSALEKAQEEARDLNLEEGWQQVPKRIKYGNANKFKQEPVSANTSTPATRMNKPRVGVCKQLLDWSK